MAAVSPEHLLEQADRLVAQPAHGAPRQADLKRAISNAYYALFHAILTRAADDVAGSSNRHTARYALVYRSVQHRKLSDLCSEIVKPNLKQKYAVFEPQGGFGQEINAVATAVVELQEKRESADYDPLFRVRMTDTIAAIATSRSAVTRLAGANATRRKMFIALVLFTPR